MHGRLKVKTTKEQEEDQKIKEREKAYNFRRLTDKLFGIRHEIKTRDNLGEFFKLSSELLLTNPDFYTVWNIRREALLENLSRQTSDADIKVMWKDELEFTVDCLKRNEKSYSAWQHRIWILSQMPNSEYEKEILLCNSLLAKDERNFHCWDHRNYICDVAKEDLEKELKFTTEKIRSNFSNFSAWHRRHKLLLRGLSAPDGDCPTSCDLKLIWPDEYKTILDAVFTDPADQSPWLYHNWLVKNHLGHLRQEHLDKLLDLQELEPTNRWVKQAVDLVRKHLSSDR